MAHIAGQVPGAGDIKYSVLSEVQQLLKVDFGAEHFEKRKFIEYIRRVVPASINGLVEPEEHIINHSCLYKHCQRW